MNPSILESLNQRSWLDVLILFIPMVCTLIFMVRWREKFAAAKDNYELLKEFQKAHWSKLRSCIPTTLGILFSLCGLWIVYRMPDPIRKSDILTIIMLSHCLSLILVLEFVRHRVFKPLFQYLLMESIHANKTGNSVLFNTAAVRIINEYLSSSFQSSPATEKYVKEFRDALARFDETVKKTQETEKAVEEHFAKKGLTLNHRHS